MQIAKILLPVLNRDDMETVADTAFVLADRYGAQVEGVYAFTPPSEQIKLYYEAAAPSYMETLKEEAERSSEEAKKRIKDLFDKLAKPHSGVSSRFLTMEGGLTRCIARRGRLADLTVIGTIGGHNYDLWPSVRDAAIYQSGRPVLVAPNAPVSADVGKTVIVAWKDTVEAARAITGARAFIENAETVHLVSAGHDAVSMDALKEVQAYLGSYAKTVKPAIIGEDKGNVAELLLEEASKYPDALMVMGAYGHWRWTEWTFGGVTQHMLQEATVPVLMAH